MNACMHEWSLYLLFFAYIRRLLALASAMPGETSILAVLVCLAAATALAAAEPPSEAAVLLRFKAATANDSIPLRDWTSVSNAGPCLGGRQGNWTGVYCEKGKVIKLVLEDMGLSGTADLSALADLPDLHSLSLMNNSLEGEFPSLRGLSRLRSLYLAHNKLSGDIPAGAFSGMDSLWSVHLEHNSFTGAVPPSLAQLQNLVDVSMQDNGFSGTLPEFKLSHELMLNVSNNRLEGPIPASLSSLQPSAFSGNHGLCGPPIAEPCERPSDSSATNPVPIVVAVIAILVIAAALLAALCCRRCSLRTEECQLGRPASSSTKKPSPSGAEAEPSSTGKRKSGGNGGRDPEQEAKLVVVREGEERLELHDLLKASAEAMAVGALRSSYKVMLPSGLTMAVKRFKEMNGMGKEEFQEHMRRLGALSHSNVLPLVAFHFRKKEKLLVTEYVPGGSLHDLLHGNRSSDGQSPLNWAARLRILKGVARGLHYLYKELPMLTTPHGHLKSSNVLLGQDTEPLLAEYGLSPVLNPAHAYEALAVYRSPEFLGQGRTTKKSDVWSLGVLILEVLSGKDPDRNAKRRRRTGEASGLSSHGINGAAELAAWAESLVQEDRAEEVFDDSMCGSGGAEKRKLLRIALACCEPEVAERCDVADAMSRIDELTSSSAADSEGDCSAYSSPH